MNGPPVAESLSSHTNTNIMTVSSRSTKAEILSAYQELRAQPTTAADVWQWLTVKCQTIARETRALVNDCYRLGVWARRCYDSARAELIRPIFKA